MKQAIKRKNFLYVQVSTYVDIYSLPKKKKKVETYNACY